MESNQIQWVGFLLHGIQNATCTNHIDKYGLSMRGVGEQLHKLITHINEGVMLALAAQGKREKPSIPFESLVNVADFDCDMIDTDQPRLAAIIHERPPGTVLPSSAAPTISKERYAAPRYLGLPSPKCAPARAPGALHHNSTIVLSR